jgi:hypothetical protein
MECVMKLSDSKVDTTRIEQGEWVDRIPELEGVRFKVRGINNKDWRKLQGRLLDAVPRRNRVGNRLSPDEMDRMNAKLLLDTILLDWDGFEDDDGNALPYSKDLAKTLLSDPAYQKVRDGVLWAAQFVADGIASDLEADAKN